MLRRFRFLPLLALLVGAVVGLTACGGDDPDANELLKQTFGGDQNVDSGKLDLALTLDAKGLQNIEGPVSLKLTGPFASSGEGKLPKLDLAVTLSGAGANFSAGAVTTGDKGWLKLQGTTFAVDDATFEEFRKGYEQASSESGEDSGPTFKSLGIDPLRWLQDPEIVGEETVGGAETYHITSGVNVAAFLDDVSELLGKAGQLGEAAQGVPSSLTEQQRKDIQAAVKDARLEVFTGKEDTTLRRLQLDIDIDVPENVRERAGGLSTGTLKFGVTINDLNEPQEITAPENARPISELQQLLTGGATGAAPAPAAPAPSGDGGGGDAGASTEYLDCIASAGSDVAEIQKCAALAGS